MIEKFQPQDMTIGNVNGGNRYSDGDVLDATVINQVVESVASSQIKVNTLVSGVEHATTDVNADASVQLVNGRLKFSNLKGKQGERGIATGSAIKVNGTYLAECNVTGDIQGQINNKLEKSGGTISGNLNVNGYIMRGNANVAMESGVVTTIISERNYFIGQGVKIKVGSGGLKGIMDILISSSKDMYGDMSKVATKFTVCGGFNANRGATINRKTLSSGANWEKQSIWDCATQNNGGLEVILRWRHDNIAMGGNDVNSYKIIITNYQNEANNITQQSGMAAFTPIYTSWVDG